MKANELMIGDWVKYYDKDLQVLSIDAYNVFLGGEIGVIDAYDIEPIPLTKEILEKNFTFDKDIDLVCHLQYDLYIQIDNITEQQSFNICNTFDVGYGREYNYIMDIQYVHELQHLLRLIEYEKEIML